MISCTVLMCVCVCVCEERVCDQFWVLVPVTLCSCVARVHSGVYDSTVSVFLWRPPASLSAPRCQATCSSWTTRTTATVIGHRRGPRGGACANTTPSSSRSTCSSRPRRCVRVCVCVCVQKGSVQRHIHVCPCVEDVCFSFTLN